MSSESKSFSKPDEEFTQFNNAHMAHVNVGGQRVIKITLKPMNDKPLSRQYIDISGNKLIPYNISNDGNGTLVTNGLS